MINEESSASDIPTTEVAEGDAAVRRQDFKTAQASYLRAVRRGSVFAEIKLGKLYEQGHLPDHKGKNALKWYTRAARKGSAEANYRIGLLYEEGRIIDRDTDAAIDAYRLAADRHVPAAYRLGRLMLANGEGVFSGEAVSWIRKAAEAGHIKAQRRLAEAYRSGVGVQKNTSETEHWRNAADFAELRHKAETGGPLDQLHLAEAYAAGRIVEANVRDAVFWYEQAAAGGSEYVQAMAYLELGDLYARNELIRDPQQARDFWQHAANLGSMPAKVRLDELRGEAERLQKEKKRRVLLKRLMLAAGVVSIAGLVVWVTLPNPTPNNNINAPRPSHTTNELPPMDKEAPSGTERYSFTEAVAKGLIRYTVTGIDRSLNLLMTVRRTTDRNVDVYFVPGTVFDPSGTGVQRMAVWGPIAIVDPTQPSNQFHEVSSMYLPTIDTRSYVVEAYCLDIHLKNPSARDSFRVLPAPAERTGLIMTLGKRNGLSHQSIQSAIWIDEDDVTRKEIQTVYKASDKEIDDAFELLKKLGPKKA